MRIARSLLFPLLAAMAACSHASSEAHIGGSTGGTAGKHGSDGVAGGATGATGGTGGHIGGAGATTGRTGGASGSGGTTTGGGGSGGGAAGGITGSGGRSVKGGASGGSGGMTTTGTSSGGGLGGAPGGTTGGGGTGGKGGAAGGGSTGGKGGTTASGGAGGSADDCAGPACGPTVDQLFDMSKLATIWITFDATDTGTYTPSQWLDLLWSKWNHCPPFEASDFVRVTFRYESPDHLGDVTMKNVGMRLRGSKARGTNTLQGFKLDFEKLIGNATGSARRRFGDVNRLEVLSIESDASHTIQCLAYKTLRKFNQPAPYCNHLKVYVNGTYYGLMESVEDPENGRFQAHHFGSTAGETYWGSPSQGDCTGDGKFSDSQAKLVYSGDSFSNYASQYKITRGSTTTAEQHLIPMLKCGDATQTSSDTAFSTCISEWIDIDEWLREIAAESLMPTLESFIMLRNYLLYFVPDSAAPHGGRFLLASWDLDTTFQKQTATTGDPFTSIPTWFVPGSRAKLGTRLTSVFKTKYCQAMRDFLSNVYKPSLIDEIQTVIAPGMQSDPTTTNTVWSTEMKTIHDFIDSHATAALTTVNSACK